MKNILDKLTLDRLYEIHINGWIETAYFCNVDPKINRDEYRDGHIILPGVPFLFVIGKDYYASIKSSCIKKDISTK